MVSIMCFSFRFVGSVCVVSTGVLTDPREGHRCPKLLLSLPHSLRQELGGATRKSHDPPVFALHSTGFFISDGDSNSGP